MEDEMESAKDFALRVWQMNASELANEIAYRDDAIRTECMKIASEYIKSLKSEDRDLWSDYEDKHLLKAMLGKMEIRRPGDDR